MTSQTDDDLLARAQQHHHRLVSAETVLAQFHGSGLIGRFNNRLAKSITLIVASMWCAYSFAMLAFVSLPAAIHSGNAVILVSWISQTFLQLVLLSVIMVGQQVLAQAADARAEADHETLQLLHDINVLQTEILQELKARSESNDVLAQLRGLRRDLAQLLTQSSAAQGDGSGPV